MNTPRLLDRNRATLKLLFEVMTGRPLHPVSYVLTGAALAVFYLVLLALSEYLPFAGLMYLTRRVDWYSYGGSDQPGSL
jgi:inner membrane protein involved in colicin E2 resistance